MNDVPPDPTPTPGVPRPDGPRPTQDEGLRKLRRERNWLIVGNLALLVGLGAVVYALLMEFS